MTMTPISRMSGAYSATETDGPSRDRLEKIAHNFRPDPKLEQILSLPDDKREAVLTTNPTLRLSIGNYTNAKAAHERLKESNR